MPQVTLNGQAIEYKARASRRARRISIRFTIRRGFELVYPLGVNSPTPEELLASKQGWILATLEKYPRHQKDEQNQQRYQDGSMFQYLGDAIRLNLLECAADDAIRIQNNGERLNFSLPANDSNNPSVIRAAIEHFYRQQAKRYLPQRTRELAEQHGFTYNRVFIKNQKTRWGSCSDKRNINLNMRLMMTPRAAIDYVIIHELCHLIHMNHSQLFWNLVAKHCPNYQYWEKWLKENGGFLVF